MIKLHKIYVWRYMKMINSAICYIEKDGKYLMLHRTKKEKDINKEKWIGVGGKFEKDEPEHADSLYLRRNGSRR